MTRTRSTLQARRVRLAIVLIVGGAALVACVMALLRWQAEPAWATYPGQNGEIAFEGRGSFGTDIFSISPDGTGLSQLTQTRGNNEYNPSYSANGSRVAFDTERDGNQEIYTMDASGGNQTRLTFDTEFLYTFDGEPAFSPDGSEIVFARVNDKGPWGFDDEIDIYTMAAEPRAEATRVVSVPGNDEQPSFKPDGSQILFGNGSTIYVVDRDGSNLAPLAEGYNPVWSPDGERIAFERDSQIFMMNADGSYQQAVVDGGEPTFSPDCTRIAYTNNVEDPTGEGGSNVNGIFTANLTGGDEQTVNTSSQNLSHPDWRPLTDEGPVDCPPLPPPPPTPQLSIGDTSVTEGEPGTTAEATFDVTLSDPGDNPVTVNYDTIDGSATQPEDYLQTGGTLTFGPGVTTATVTVPVNGDAVQEGDEDFSVILWNPENADLADDTGLGTIVDDDAGTGNQAPVASDDSYSIGEDFTYNSGVPGVLGNDTDADGDSLTAELVSGPSHGELALNADGSFTYTSALNYNGSDLFTYRARDDGGAESDVATVRITVNPVNDAPTISLPGPPLIYTENDPPTVIDPLATVSDPDSPDFENGRLTVGFILPFTATDDDRLEIRDQGTAAGQIGVSGTNVTYGGTTIGTFTGGIGRSSLVIDFNANATPEAAQELVRNITYRNVSDTPGAMPRLARFSLFDGDISGTRSVQKQVAVIPVNDAPTAIDDSYNINEDTRLTVLAAEGLLKNDTDAENDALQVADADPNEPGINPVDGPANGTLTLNADGSFEYAPDLDYNGPDSFTYRVCDNGIPAPQCPERTATVNLTVNPVNDAPTISLPGAILPYTENDPAMVIDPQATASDLDSSDFANGRLSVGYVSPSVRSVDDRLEIRDQGTAAGQIGVSGTNVTYGGTTIGTFEGGSGTRFTLTITLNAEATRAAVQELMRNITYRNVSDAPAGPFRMVRFTLSDGDGGLSNPADKFIPVIQVNDAPVNAVPGDQSTNEDTALTFNSTNNNLISISDADASTNAVQVRLAATNGKLTLNGTSGLTFAPGDSGSADDDMTFTGSITDINSALNGLEFDPDANFSGDASLEITTNDQGNTGSGGALSDADTVSISVNAVNAAPVAEDDDGGATDEDTPLEILAEDLLANDTDPEGDTLSISAFDDVSAQGGTVNLEGGTFTYTPVANYNGPDSFTYKVSDGNAESNVATVTITVNPVNDAPVASEDTYSIDYGQATNTILSVSDSSGVLANDTDPEGDSLMAMLASTTSSGQLALNATGSFTYTPRAENFNGQGTFTDSFTYRAGDGTAASTTTVVRITVGRQCTITGTPNSDSGKATLIGSSGPDVLCSLAGNDTVRGANGNDLVFGDQGQDTLKGEGGDDRVVAKDGSADTLDCGAGNDTVLGFDQGLDKIAKNCENQLPRG